MCNVSVLSGCSATVFAAIRRRIQSLLGHKSECRISRLSGGASRSNNPSVTEQIKRVQADIASLQLRTQRCASTSTPRASRVFMGSQDLRARTDSRTNKPLTLICRFQFFLSDAFRRVVVL